MRLLVLLAALGVTGLSWADGPKEGPKDGAPTTRLVIKDMT